MKKPYLVILSFVLLISCKEKIQKFVFDASKMNTLTQYSYEYQSNKLKFSKEVNFTIMFGQKLDTMVTLKTYEYDDKGLLRKEISKTDFEEDSSIRLFYYNSNDSLIRNILISPNKDTTDWREFDYFPDGKKEIYSRIIHHHIEPNQDFSKLIENRNFDTIVCRRVYQYENDLCKSLKEYDDNNKLTRMVEYEYDNKKLIRETYTSPINSMEITDRIKYFDYSKSDKFPDYYSLDKRNDTIDYCHNEFVNDSLYLKTMVMDHGKFAEKIFYTNGRKIGMISVSKEMNFKTTESYSYYENGDVKEIKAYNEK